MNRPPAAAINTGALARRIASVRVGAYLTVTR
jgi:hypothetical protein